MQSARTALNTGEPFKFAQAIDPRFVVSVRARSAVDSTKKSFLQLLIAPRMNVPLMPSISCLISSGGELFNDSTRSTSFYRLLVWQSFDQI